MTEPFDRPATGSQPAPDPYGSYPATGGSYPAPISGSSPATGGYPTGGYPPAPLGASPYGNYPATPAPPGPADLPPYPTQSSGYPAPYPAVTHSPDTATRWGGMLPRNGNGHRRSRSRHHRCDSQLGQLHRLILNALAVIFGAVGLNRAKKGQATNKSMAMAGLVLGVIGLALFLILIIVGVALLTSR